jgi:ribonuclease VapC
MVIDTSVLIAILADEPEAELFEAAIDADPIRLISAASVLETAIVAGARYGDIGGRELDLLLYKAGIQIVAVTPDQVDAGRDAFNRYGKGRHRAALNFGDCFSYALAKTAGEPLLFKGNDFPQTDIAMARL